MTNRAKAKGSAFEALVRDYLRARGIPAERTVAGMASDRGDLAGVPHWTIECKNLTDLHRAVREGLADLAVEQANAGTPHGCVVVKRHGKTDPAAQLVVMTLDRWVDLLVEMKG